MKLCILPVCMKCQYLKQLRTALLPRRELIVGVRLTVFEAISQFTKISSFAIINQPMNVTLKIPCQPGNRLINAIQNHSLRLLCSHSQNFSSLASCWLTSLAQSADGWFSSARLHLSFHKFLFINVSSFIEPLSNRL